MTTAGNRDGNGNHHGEDGRFVSKDALEAQARLVDRIFEEREKSTEFARSQLERALNEYRDAVNKALVEAKAAADAVNRGINERLDNLESGGAPFASRLDQSLTELKEDVETLKTDTVRSTGEEHTRLKRDV
ncbi:MAG: hypothetical protein M3P43_02255, partial [Actinomycetota bacterium]|nr:hypothetical protein [Actinomycetota bacterium]